MMKLMKYEFRKTWAPKVILLGITAAVQIAYLISVFSHSEEWTAGMAGLLTALAVGGIMMMGLMSVVTLHRDMNTKQSYMLFMTPNSSYKILGAKVAENGLSMLLTGAFFFALGVLDITLLFSQFATLADLWDVLEQVFRMFGQAFTLDASSLACLVFGLLASWFATVNSAYLADVTSSALLNGKKYNGVLTFVFFLLIAILLSWLQNIVVHLLIGTPPAVIVEGTAMSLGSNFGSLAQLPAGFNEAVRYNNQAQLIRGVVALIYAGIMYVCTAELMERKLSV